MRQELSTIDKIPKYTLFILYFFILVLGLSVIFEIFSALVQSDSLYTDIKKPLVDHRLLESIFNTFILYGISVSVQIVMAIFLTIIFRRIRNWMKPILIAPYAMGVVAPSFSFLVFFSPAVGPFNIGFLGNKAGVYFAISFIDTWQWLGILLLACFLILERIPPEHFEQATLERIGTFKQWWLIVFPKISTIFCFYALIRLIDWLRKVDLIRILFGNGGPGYCAETVGTYITKLYYQSGQEAYSNFLLLLQLILLGLFLYSFMRFSNLNKLEQ